MLPGYLLGFFANFFDFSAILLRKMNFFIIFDIVIFFRFFLCRVLQFL